MEVGTDVGIADVGVALGTKDGAALGVAVGVVDGEELGAAVGTEVGNVASYAAVTSACVIAPE